MSDNVLIVKIVSSLAVFSIGISVVMLTDISIEFLLMFAFITLIAIHTASDGERSHISKRTALVRHLEKDKKEVE